MVRPKWEQALDVFARVQWDRAHADIRFAAREKVVVLVIAELAALMDEVWMLEKRYDKLQWDI